MSDLYPSNLLPSPAGPLVLRSTHILSLPPFIFLNVRFFSYSVFLSLTCLFSSLRFSIMSASETVSAPVVDSKPLETPAPAAEPAPVADQAAKSEEPAPVTFVSSSFPSFLFLISHSRSPLRQKTKLRSPPLLQRKPLLQLRLLQLMLLLLRSLSLFVRVSVY